MRRWVIPVWRDNPLTKIGRSQITLIFDRLPVSSPALPRNLFALLRKLFVWAVERGDLDRSPFAGLGVPKPVASRTRVLSEAELIGVLLASMDPTMAGPFGYLIRFLLITGQRRDEVAGMMWEELDQERRTWTIPADRSKNHKQHVVPLTDHLLRNLDELVEGCPWPLTGPVFTTNGVTSVSGFSRLKKRLDRLALQFCDTKRFPPWRLHDLRRTVATNLQMLGVRLEVTEALLNHVGKSKSGVAGVYHLHEFTVEKREALELWSDHLQRVICKFADKYSIPDARVD